MDQRRANRVAQSYVLRQWEEICHETVKEIRKDPNAKDSDKRYSAEGCMPNCACTDCSEAIWSIENLDPKYKEDERIPAYATLNYNNWSLLCFCQGKHRWIGGYVLACGLNPPQADPGELLGREEVEPV